MPLQIPSQTLAAQLLPHIKDKSLSDFALDKRLPIMITTGLPTMPLRVMREMELSTQMLLFDAISKGLHFEILDEQDQFLKLWHKDHVEYVKMVT